MAIALVSDAFRRTYKCNFRLACDTVTQTEYVTWRIGNVSLQNTRYFFPDISINSADLFNADCVFVMVDLIMWG